MKLNDAVIGAILVVLGLAVVVHVQGFPRIPGQTVGPGLFPGLIAAGLAVCGALLIASGIRHRAAQPWFVAGAWSRTVRGVASVAAVIVAIAAYVLLGDALGFVVVAPAILVGLFVVFGVRPLHAAGLAVVASLVIWYVFYKLLRVPLPWGVLKNHAF
ncbi:MAG: tripartite tricarboxylate transporter TctB family protein [Burkholderiales bacterium]|nr:tripartite tricarboxylate transporter TctB family protein [Burkholderiales bacterium]